MKIKKVKCQSGLIGEQFLLQDAYSNYEEFENYSHIYNLHGRLGYKTPKTAWKTNPLIQSSVIPSDFRKVGL